MDSVIKERLRKKCAIVPRACDLKDLPLAKPSIYAPPRDINRVGDAGHAGLLFVLGQCGYRFVL